eukprot:CAMPEP_0119377270 /NCGR_PEP_ID=MMETSP1334-20130426/44009_1 /TAXON_ID=127549 /ORGANISM="Calcidiscus leptoporus, Strain RCC1130" /LENGTH=87 /DNA_ID=CAMNT_0007396117 /DNA_START=8 /DNA_END=267 /DNA_ORIENTATION=-
MRATAWAGIGRRAALGWTAAALAPPPSAVPGLADDALPAQYGKNLAERKLEQVVSKKVAAMEKQLGFALEADDVLGIEAMLRNKYCG